MIYNTLAKKKMPFEPLEPGKVKMYVCGPTTYNYIHLGNARPIVVFDTVRRYFSYLGYDVTFVSNLPTSTTRSSTAPTKKARIQWPSRLLHRRLL